MRPAFIADQLTAFEHEIESMARVVYRAAENRLSVIAYHADADEKPVDARHFAWPLESSDVERAPITPEALAEHLRKARASIVAQIGQGPHGALVWRAMPHIESETDYETKTARFAVVCRGMVAADDLPTNAKVMHL